VVHFLLDRDGLGYASLPKGLLKFHIYPEGGRTAFEEHLVEAANYVARQNGSCAVHFTVSKEHLVKFKTRFSEVRSIYENKYDVSFQVTFSFQKNRTDTISVDRDNMPFRQNDGRLLFRPGGHGALLENLNDLDADIIFIKNIDNVAPDRLKRITYSWKKALGGHLIGIQERLFGYMKDLHTGTVRKSSLDDMIRFWEIELCQPCPSSLYRAPLEEKRHLIMQKFNRPIRVCGMVKNVKEPGGGPFWVQNEAGIKAIQVLEKAQINPQSEEQIELFEASTHFSPVDFVCGVRDWQGRPYHLPDYVDQDTYLISQKSKEGRDLKALEHPGLWNGSMARWISVFVEVPLETFTPVKTVNDLLRNEHQPED